MKSSKSPSPPRARFRLGASLYRSRWLKKAADRAWPFFRHLTWVCRQLTQRRTRVVAVVGSYGKSTTVRIIKTALGEVVDAFPRHNAGYAVGFELLRCLPTRHWAVIEVGINGPGQMKLLARMLRPDITVVTSIGFEHIGRMKSIEVTRQEKSEMVAASRPGGLAVVNGDDAHVLWTAKSAPCRVARVGADACCDVRIEKIRLRWPHGTEVVVRIEDDLVTVRTGLYGRHWGIPIAAALRVALELGVDPVVAAERLAPLLPSRGRLEPCQLENGAWVIRDDAQSGFDTALAALDLLAEVPARRKILIMGETPDLPEPSAQNLAIIGQRVAEAADYLIVLDDVEVYAMLVEGAVAGGMRSNQMVRAGHSIASALAALPTDLGAGDVVLLKGSTGQRLGRIFHHLAGRRVTC